MTTKVICRCLAADGSMLGWVQIDAQVRGDGQLWSPGPVVVMPLVSGFCTTLSMHWCDPNVEVRTPITAQMVAGVPSMLFAQSSPVITVGPMPQNLPPVTVGSASVDVPVGGLGARG